jgi:hypothetical protein
MDEFPDVTDPRDVFSMPVDEPDETDWYMNDLTSAIEHLEDHTPFGYERDLVVAQKKLTKILENVRRPF